MNSQIEDFYRELDLENGADLSSVRLSYRQLVKVWHPDRFGNDQKLQAVANDKLKKINFAYEALLAFLENTATYQSAKEVPIPLTKSERDHKAMLDKTGRTSELTEILLKAVAQIAREAHMT